MHGGTRLNTRKQPPHPQTRCTWQSGAHSSFPSARLCLHPPLAALNIWRRGTRPRIPHCAGADLRFISLVSCPEQTQQQTLLQLSTALVSLMYQQCVHSIEPPVRTWSHYRQKGICTALSSEEAWSLKGLILIHGKRQHWNSSKRKDGCLTVYVSPFWSPNLQIKGVYKWITSTLREHWWTNMAIQHFWDRRSHANLI